MTDFRIIDHEYVIYDALGDEKARVPFKTKEEVISMFNNDLLSPKEKGIYGMLFSEKEFLPIYLPSKQKWQIIESKNSEAYQDAWIRNYDQPMSLKAAAMIVVVSLRTISCLYSGAAEQSHLGSVVPSVV